jgi:glyoxalase family protein
MIHRLRWRVASRDALAFWSERLGEEGVRIEWVDGKDAIRFTDPEGLGLELAVVETEDEPLRAEAEDVPVEFALLGFDGVRVYGPGREEEHRILTDTMGFQQIAPGEYRLAGRRTASYGYDDPPAAVGLQGAGTVHHIAWCDRDEEHAAWRDRLAAAGERPTPVIDRQYFLSIYFREPRGVLFELATPSPGFAIDEDPEHLGEQLRLPPQHEHLRERLEATLVPLVNPRAGAARP